MPSRGSARPVRVGVERGLRVVAIGALIAWVVLAAMPAGQAVVVATGGDVAAGLPRWTRTAAARVHARLDTTPDARTAAWLAGLRRAGVDVSWSGDALIPTAIETFRAAEPASGAVVLASSVDDTIIVTDALGTIDTLGGAAALRLASFEAPMAVRAGEQVARATSPAGAAPGRVLVIGSAGWEAKFLIAALEEAGWGVDARLAIGPGQEVVQGNGRSLPDTGRHAVVALLDSAAAQSTRGVEEFVRAGGGLVLAGSANRAARLATLRGWSARGREVAPLGTLPGDTLWRGGARIPVRLEGSEAAIALEQRNGSPTLVARRHYAGRVIGVGYDETWRWRMAGGENSVADHRAWWSRIVSSVARRATGSGLASASASPVASLYDRLGDARPSPDGGATFPRGLLVNMLGAVLLASLLAEWLLRRSRGAR